MHRIAIIVASFGLALTALPTLLVIALCGLPILAFMLPMVVMAGRGIPWAPRPVDREVRLPRARTSARHAPAFA